MKHGQKVIPTQDGMINMEQFEDKFSDAYVQGFNAYWNGESFLDNPYKQGTLDYNEWRDGWSDNRAVDEEQENGC